MRIREIIRTAQGIADARPFVLREDLFSRRGKKDMSSLPAKIGEIRMKCTSVFGGVAVSVLSIVKDSVTIPIFIENLIWSENPELAKKYQDEMGENEAVSYVEKVVPHKGMAYYTIICVSKTYCGSRFAICKELLHIYTDTVQANRIAKAGAILKNAMSWRESDFREDVELDPETSCFFLATETMLPWIFRDAQYAAIKRKFGQVQSCALQAAQSFMIPLSVIEFVGESVGVKALSYYGFSYRINSEIASQRR